MLNYDEMIKCGQKYAVAKKQMSIAKYKEFVNYLKKIIDIIFEDSKEQIASYLKETIDQAFLLDWNVGGIHYDGFVINRFSSKSIDIISLRAHDSYYDPVLKLESDIDDEELLSFFNKEYKYFIDLFAPNYYLEEYGDKLIDERYSLVCRIAEKFNEVCFNHFQTYFESLGILEVRSYIDSKFSLSFTDERRKELDKAVFDEYELYRGKIAEITKKFDESVKDLK
jgi:hypothetical protein